MIFPRPLLASIFLSSVLGSATVSLADPVKLRGPYLQKANSTELTVCWRTDVGGIGRVRYGLVENQLNSFVEGPLATDHKVRLTGLTPGTLYFYKVETDATVLADGPDYHFRTSPVVGSTGPVRFWALGDAGTASVYQMWVRDAFAPIHAQKPADFMVMLGDNAYYSGTDAQYQAAVFEMYAGYLPQLPLWSCIGNHETYGGPIAGGGLAYDDIFDFPANAECGGVASGTERYHSWNYGNIHFVSLDSMTSDRSFNGAMATWLEADLSANLLPWTIALFHHPAYTHGSHNSDYEGECVQMRQNIIPILEDHGVDLVLNGHSHAYERSFLLDGHYGSSWDITPQNKVNAGNGREDGDGAYTKPSPGAASHEGAVYIVAGSSGQLSGGSLDHTAHFISLNLLGSLVVDVSDNRLDVKFLREQGAATTYDDYFTIIKGVPPAPQAPSGLALLPTDPTHALVHWEDNSAAEDSFTVLISEDDLEYQTAVTAGANATVATLQSLVPGKTYFVKITAANVTGIATSAAFSFTQPVAAPGAISNIEKWRFQFWGATDDLDDRADLADADHDGMQNLMEYALGSSPRNPISIVMPDSSRDAVGKLKLTFQRAALPEIRYSVEFSADLSPGSWQQEFTSFGAANVAGTIVVTDPSPAPVVRKFARLRVERP